MIKRKTDNLQKKNKKDSCQALDLIVCGSFFFFLSVVAALFRKLHGTRWKGRLEIPTALASPKIAASRRR